MWSINYVNNERHYKHALMITTTSMDSYRDKGKTREINVSDGKYIFRINNNVSQGTILIGKPTTCTHRRHEGGLKERFRINLKN